MSVIASVASVASVVASVARKMFSAASQKNIHLQLIFGLSGCTERPREAECFHPYGGQPEHIRQFPVGA